MLWQPSMLLCKDMVIHALAGLPYEYESFTTNMNANITFADKLLHQEQGFSIYYAILPISKEEFPDTAPLLVAFPAKPRKEGKVPWLRLVSRSRLKA